ncbi:MAG: hypothetical protein IPF48_04145 [Sphingomonadales bacterium]|nr:hypothetical protein [Sphingomonadales bacterium]
MQRATRNGMVVILSYEAGHAFEPRALSLGTKRSLLCSEPGLFDSCEESYREAATCCQMLFRLVRALAPD